MSYWGKGALKHTGLLKRINHQNSKLVQVICDLSSGACNPEPIKELMSAANDKVQVRTLCGLHAKVWICGLEVIVGSANVSANGLGFDDPSSMKGNVEAAIEVRDADIAEKVTSWFSEQWERVDCVEVTECEIERAVDLWTARGSSSFVKKVKDSCNEQKKSRARALSSNTIDPPVPREEVTDRLLRYEIFYKGLLNALKDTDIPGKVKAPQTSGCYFRPGFNGISYAVHFGRHKKVRVELKINGPEGKRWNKKTFDLLKEHKTPIDKMLGTDLKWERMDKKITSHIALYRPGSIYSKDEECNLEEIHMWFKKTLVAFRETFDPYLRELIEN